MEKDESDGVDCGGLSDSPNSPIFSEQSDEDWYDAGQLPLNNDEKAEGHDVAAHSEASSGAEELPVTSSRLAPTYEDLTKATLNIADTTRPGPPWTRDLYQIQYRNARGVLDTVSVVGRVLDSAQAHDRAWDLIESDGDGYPTVHSATNFINELSGDRYDVIMETSAQNDFDSVQWRRDDDQTDGPAPEATTSAPQAKIKSNGKRRQERPEGIPDHNADATDLAGIGSDGYLMCTVDTPQKENDGTKDAFVSYMISTNSDFKTFDKQSFTVRRRFTDFVYLYKTLFNMYPYLAVPPLPDKHNLQWVTGDRFGPDFTQRRAHSLHRFIRRIALHPVLRRNATFLMFLETPDWNSVMRGSSGPRGRGSSISDQGQMGGPLGSLTTTAASSASTLDRFQDRAMNFLKAPHKPDKRFIAVREKADKLDEDLASVEKGVTKVTRREGDLQADWADLAVQFRKLVHLEPGISDELTHFAVGVEAMSKGMKELRETTDQDYLGSLRDMQAYVTSVKALLKTREQKQLDFEGLTDYLTKAAYDRDTLASERGPPTLASGAGSFIRGKIEDVRGVDHEQSRQHRLRKTELKIDELTRAVEEAKNTSEAFDDQVVKETAEFERIKAVEFRDTMGGLAAKEAAFWRETVAVWEGVVEDLKGEK